MTRRIAVLAVILLALVGGLLAQAFRDSTVGTIVAVVAVVAALGDRYMTWG